MTTNTINDAVTMDNEPTMRPGGADSLGRIDQYELVRELGGGGFGTVYLARDTVAGIEVAVKGLPPIIKNNAEELERIRANFALVSRLHHPYIAAALVLHPAREVIYCDPSVRQKLRVDPGDTLMVMAYAPGVTLSRWRKQFPGGKVPFEIALQLSWQIAQALDYAHGQHIIHRDIKPSNVVVETQPNGEVTARLLDFGLAAEVRSSMGRVSREIHDTSGTRPYMAPEQWAGRKQGPATDQYALAVLFHELITGEVPFSAVFDTGDPVVMMNVVGREQFTPPDGLAKPVRLALEKALAKKPEERFASCADFVAALSGKAKVSRGCGRATLVAAAVLAIAALAGSGAWLYHQQQKAVRRDQSRIVVEQKAESHTGPKHGDFKTLTLPGGAKMEMIYVAAGEFMMGSPTGEEGRDDNETQRRVTLTKGYWLGKYEVTQRQWQSVMGDNPSRFEGESRPVDRVSWEDCQRFIQKVNAAARQQLGGEARLPTEAEWEYACRAGTATAYHWGNALNGDKANCDGNRPCGTTSKGTRLNETTPVGQYAANPWGFYDMQGNVWEWCNDWYGDSGRDATDPQGPASGDIRVLRGGSWCSSARDCRSAFRSGFYPGARDIFYCGFRLCCSAGPNE